MIIEKIEIESFASYKNAAFDLSDGVNLIEGSNESGKSTIADFIKFILYGAGGKGSDSHLSERRRLMNFNESHIGGSMTVRCGGAHLRISRNTAVSGSVRETARTRVVIIDLDTGEEIPDGGKEPGELLLGIDEDVFLASAYLGQRGDGSIDGESIHESISNILFSGDERLSVQKAADKIESARIPLLHKHGNKGRLVEIREELTALNTKLAEEMQTNTLILEKEAEVRDRSRKNAEHIEKYTEYEKRLRAYDNAKLIENYEALQIAERDKVASEMKMLEYRAIAHIPTDDEMDELRTYEGSLMSLDLRLSDSRAQKSALELERTQLSPSLKFGKILEHYNGDIAERAERLHASVGKLTVAGVISLLLGIAAAAVGFFVNSLRLPLLIAGGVLALTGILLLILSGSKRAEEKKILRYAGCEDTQGLYDAVADYERALARSGELDSLIRDKEIQINEGEELILSERGRLAEFLEEMDVEVVTVPMPSLPGITQVLTERQRKAYELEREYSTQLAVYNALYAKTENVDIQKVRTQLAESGVESPADADRDKLESSARFYRVQSEAQNNEIHRLEIELAELRAKVTDPATVRERISALESELEAGERRHAALVLASESLRTAAEELRRSVAPALAASSGGYMSTLTDGRYSDMSVSSSFDLAYYCDGEYRHIDHMSRGTQDMAYLSLRLSLGDMISREGGLITVLDEATAHLDDTRAERLLRLLCQRSAAGHQHILFTCHERESRILDAIGAEYNHIML